MVLRRRSLHCAISPASRRLYCGRRTKAVARSAGKEITDSRWINVRLSLADPVMLPNGTAVDVYLLRVNFRRFAGLGYIPSKRRIIFSSDFRRR